MYQWREIPIHGELEKKLDKIEEEFINSLADIVTKTIMSSLDNFDLNEVERIIHKIKNNPGLIGVYSQENKDDSSPS